MTKKHNNWFWFFTAPCILGMIFFTVAPLIFSIFLSFTKYDMFNPPKWVGLRNYIELIKDPGIWVAFRNITLFSFLNECIKIPLACVLAAFLNQKLRSIRFFRVVYFLPYLTPVAAVAMIWTLMYNPDNGLLNYLFGFVGLGPFDFIYSTDTFQFIMSVVGMVIWKGIGYTVMFLIAGLQNVSPELLEAASIDGAGTVKKFMKVTLPMLTPTIFFLFIVGFSSSFQAFEEFYLLTKTYGGDNQVVNGVIYQYVWISANKVGLGAALGWISFVFIGIFTYVQRKFESRWVHYE